MESARQRECLFTTKAGTLMSLQKVITTASILPLYVFTLHAWRLEKSKILHELRGVDWFHGRLIVRSSGVDEDGSEHSMAGCFASVIDIQGEDAFHAAVEEVIASFNDTHPGHEILVQPFLADVAMAGVAFSRDPNTNGSYIIINYDDDSGQTHTITSGQSNQKCHVHHHHAPVLLPTELRKIHDLVSELMYIFDSDSIDIEFAIDKKGNLYLFQVRPLVVPAMQHVSPKLQQQALTRIAAKVALGTKEHPYLHGRQTVYGIMPDWNPAEIIGVRPKPLALSLYREVITNSVWAYQRDNYGYANLRSFPLLVDFEGLPYIDVRVSFNSFLPKDLPAELSERLVNYYLDRLIQSPELHDKVEFDIVYSCYTLDLRERLHLLSQYGFQSEDEEAIFSSLVKLTNGIIHNQKGLWKNDLEKISELERRQALLFQSDLDPVSKMYWILEDCKRYGTLPFAGLARAGFVAVQILKSFVSVGIISEDEYFNFLSSVNSVSSTMNEDFHAMPAAEFLAKYGHLRPGTYDILSPRYDEQPDLYFDWSREVMANVTPARPSFSLTISQLRQIQELIERDKLDIKVLELLEFIKIAIESREYSKFIFSRSLSEFLKILAAFGAEHGFTREDCAYININSIMGLYSSSVDPVEVLHKCIQAGKKQHAMTAAICLPPLIVDASQVWSFEFPVTSPNFITQESATGHVVFPDISKDDLHQAILMIPSADPGYDWIFSHKIAGFITQYGGVNSHMAIRAGELGIPAIIGVGEVKFKLWGQAKRLTLDCLNKQVHIL